MSVDADWIRERSLDLCWSLWSSLGVPTWEGAHRVWSIELEPLIVFTAQVADGEPRLLRESVGWCVANEHLVSLRQFRHVSKRSHGAESVARFAATMSSLTSRSWPGAEEASPYDVVEARATRLTSLREPARLQLRLRATFGVGARAEIARVLLLHAARAWPASEISERVAYTRRQVEADLDGLALGGLVERQRASSGWQYRVALQQSAADLFGPFPDIAPRWSDVFTVLVQLEGAARQLDERRWRAPDVELTHRMREMREALHRLQLRPPSPSDPRSYVSDWHRWIEAWVEPLAQARPDGLPGSWQARPIGGQRVG